jgi:hypothetical protein
MISGREEYESAWRESQPPRLYLRAQQTVLGRAMLYMLTDDVAPKFERVVFVEKLPPADEDGWKRNIDAQNEVYWRFRMPEELAA